MTPRLDNCRSCSAPIVWIKLTGGRRMPIDPDPVEGGNIRAWPERGTGEVLSATGIEQADGPLYVSHFATCPQAGEWRR
jgi:hypothetical protein